MGKPVNAFRGVSLSPGREKQVLALDKEFENLQGREKKLEIANLKLQEDARPGKRGRAALKNGREDEVDFLAEVTEKMLTTIANAAIPKNRAIASIGATGANGERHIDVLLGRRFITESRDTIDGTCYRATAEGRAYLARNNKP